MCCAKEKTVFLRQWKLTLVRAETRKYGHRLPTWKGENSWFCMNSTRCYLGDGGCAGAHSSAIPTTTTTTTAIREAQVEKWFCGIQQTPKWNNILLSVLKKKSSPLKIFQRPIGQVGPIQLCSTGSCKTLTYSLFIYFLTWHELL